MIYYGLLSWSTLSSMSSLSAIEKLKCLWQSSQLPSRIHLLAFSHDFGMQDSDSDSTATEFTTSRGSVNEYPVTPAGSFLNSYPNSCHTPQAHQREEQTREEKGHRRRRWAGDLGVDLFPVYHGAPPTCYL